MLTKCLVRFVETSLRQRELMSRHDNIAGKGIGQGECLHSPAEAVLKHLFRSVPLSIYAE